MANQLRGIAGEYGVELPPSLSALRLAASTMIADEKTLLTAIARQVLQGLREPLRALDTRITALTQSLAKTQPADARLLTIPGFGPIISAAFLAAVGTGQQFKSGRHLAAWLAVCHDNTAPGGMSNCMASPKMATAAGEPCLSTAHVR